MDDKVNEFILYVAAYLYSLTDDYEDKNTEWHIQYFITTYNKYKHSKHEGDCTQQPFSCQRCFVESYIEEASFIINKKALNDHLKGLEE